MRRALFHVHQSLGIDRDGDDWLMLTDGAHVENLGMYVLLRRRCRLIVVSDCGQEEGGAPEERRFDALVHVLQQAAIDGVEIGPFLSSRAYRHLLRTGNLPADGSERPGCRHSRSSGLELIRPRRPESSGVAAGGGGVLTRLLGLPRPKPDADAAPKEAAPAPSANGQDVTVTDFAQEHYLFTWIRYPDGSRGLLVYLRPTLTGDEGDALLHGVLHSQFPDDDPVDQFYTPARMNTYRLLGRHIADELMEDDVMKRAIDVILNGGEIAPPPPKHPRRDPAGSCREDCGEGERCGANLSRSLRRESLAAVGPREEDDNGNGNGNGNGGARPLEAGGP